MRATHWGLEGGINPYAYVNGNPVNLVDPLGLTARTNWDYFWDWALGRGANARTYGPTSVETREMEKSPAAEKMRDAFIRSGCKNGKFDYGTFEAYWDTTVNPFTADRFETPFEVGGFGGASIINNGNGTVTYSVPNVSGTHSFWLHLVPDRKSPTGYMRNIKQNFTWTEPLPAACGCAK